MKIERSSFLQINPYLYAQGSTWPDFSIRLLNMQNKLCFDVKKRSLQDPSSKTYKDLMKMKSKNPATLRPSKIC